MNLYVDENYRRRQQILSSTSLPKPAEKSTELKRLSFTEWLTDRNITFIIISILLVWSLERFSKGMHSDLVTPAFRGCFATIGFHAHNPQHKTWQRVLTHVFEVSFSLIILYLLSVHAFKHKCSNLIAPPTTTNAAAKTNHTEQFSSPLITTKSADGRQTFTFTMDPAKMIFIQFPAATATAS